MRKVSEDLWAVEHPIPSPPPFPTTNVSNKEPQNTKPHKSLCQFCHLDSIYPGMR